MTQNKDEIILRVKDLRISFRTISGKLQAVRGINFNLVKGQTLAIVGESGSGKSVTTRAIMGILAKNSIVESGEILYNGQDLLNISEDDFHRIRGDKISMIFQDPLSSLNPIIRIGKQLTEATLLKNKANRKENKRDFKLITNNLYKAINDAENNAPEAVNENKKLFDEFKKFEELHLKMQAPYNVAYNAATDADVEVDDLIFNIEKKVKFDLDELFREFIGLFKKSYHEYVISDKDKVDELSNKLVSIERDLLKKKAKSYEPLLKDLKVAKEMITTALGLVKPDLFAYGYYLTYVEEKLPSKSVEELNELTSKKMIDNFMNEFVKKIAIGLDYSNKKSLEAVKKAIPVLKANRPVFNKENYDKAEVKKAIDEMSKCVKATIDPLALLKDSYTYTFEEGIKKATVKYFKSIVVNAKEEKRFAKETKKYDAKIAKGKTLNWKPIPANIVDRNILVKNILGFIDNLINIYEKRAETSSFDAKETSKTMVSLLKEKTSGSVYKVTKTMAKNKAIKLMTEVGIPEPRKRFRQYPFEFSGGMRQRIVIAIALSANPEILICDEPTTALDVTIQAQILELINKIKEERKLTIIFITHNLGVVANMADKIAVMYAGKIVEYGTTDDIFYNPVHPYTWALLASMPDLETKEKLDAIPGTPPNMIYPPKGDAFAPRNKYALNIDFEKEPPMFKISPTHFAATWLADPRSPKVELPSIVEDRIKRMKAKYGKEIKEELAAEKNIPIEESFGYGEYVDLNKNNSKVKDGEHNGK